MGRTATRTTGGTTGNIITNTTLQSTGFGVFAYYTGTKTYDEAQYYDGAAVDPSNRLAPNFMWNQSVTYSGGWTYTPVKYWPNEIQNGNVDQQSPAAQGSNSKGGKVSFFAYAPYLASGSIGDDGITGISANNLKGDPTISYKVGAIANFVDLLWGTKGDNTATSVISGGDTGNTGVADNEDAATHYTEVLLTGKTTNTDLTKQELDGKVDFAFKHALAKVGGFEGLQIKVDADAVSGGTLNQTGSDPVTAGTKVTVKSITIKAKAMHPSADTYYTDQAGTLNLATGVWTITSTTGAAAEWTYTIDGDKLNTAIAEVTSPSSAWGNQPRGVYETAQNVYSSADIEEPIIFIPGIRPELTVTVDYMVRTKDDNLNLGYSEVEQVITRAITFGEVELNKYYKLLIRLGLTEINFNATVSDWDDASGGGAGTEINLPLNVN